MPASVWDDIGHTFGAQMALEFGQYNNLIALFKAAPHDPNNAQAVAAGKKLNAALAGTYGVNDTFARPLNNALADPVLRDRIVKLSQENPAALNQVMDNIVRHPENTAAIIGAIPDPSRQTRVAQAAQAKRQEPEPAREPEHDGTNPAATADVRQQRTAPSSPPPPPDQPGDDGAADALELPPVPRNPAYRRDLAAAPASNPMQNFMASLTPGEMASVEKGFSGGLLTGILALFTLPFDKLFKLFIGLLSPAGLGAIAGGTPGAGSGTGTASHAAGTESASPAAGGASFTDLAAARKAYEAKFGPDSLKELQEGAILYNRNLNPLGRQLVNTEDAELSVINLQLARAERPNPELDAAFKAFYDQLPEDRKTRISPGTIQSLTDFTAVSVHRLLNHDMGNAEVRKEIDASEIKTYNEKSPLQLADNNPAAAQQKSRPGPSLARPPASL